MSEVVLHDYWRSSAAYRVRIGLNLKGIAYRTAVVDLLAGDQRGAEYRALNPSALVPTLEIDGHVLTQSLAILDYLDAKVRNPRFVSPDPVVRSRTLARALAIASDIHPLNNMRVVGELRTRFGADDGQVLAWMHEWMQRGFAALERDAPEQGLFGGDLPDLADICFVPQMYNARRWQVPLVDYPKIVRIDAELRNIPAFAAAAPEAVKPG
jgi:maleylacetoacetate isomerase